MVFSGIANSEPCEEMSQRFFIEEMDGIIGVKAPPVKNRPKYVAKLLEQIKSKYPDRDPTECMSIGLKAAQQEMIRQKKPINSKSVRI